MINYEMYDLLTNMDLGSGICRCHTNLDIVLDATGDLAIISGTQEIQQRFLLYLGTPKGERYDPTIGCSALDYLHEKNTFNNTCRMAQDVMMDYAYQFPEVGIKSVTCMIDAADEYSTHLDVTVGEGSMQFLYTPSELMALTTQLSNIVESDY